jgi:hypothetical protein
MTGQGSNKLGHLKFHFNNIEEEHEFYKLLRLSGLKQNDFILLSIFSKK